MHLCNERVAHGRRFRICVSIKWSTGGAVAQLGARLDGIEEVVGSNPIGSTNFLRVRPGNIGNTLYRLHR